MTSTVKSFIQYSIIAIATVALVWFSLRGLTVGEEDSGSYQDKWQYLHRTWQQADKGWLIAMAVIAIISHYIRALRWKMLLEPTGNFTKTRYAFLSLMVGYLVNLVIPRGGEVSRCYNLYKLDSTPVETSFGTVVLERIVDVICLLILIIASFIIEADKLLAFIATLPIGAGDGSSKIPLIVAMLAGLTVVLVVSYWIVKRNRKVNAFVKKTWLGFREGLLSVFRLENKGLFIFYSVFIWALYFVMSYFVIMAFRETAHLGFSAVMSLFAIGSIAMAAPLPGGTGSYHVLVPQGLVFLYNVPQADAVAFTFIFHGWQTAIMIVGGAVSLIIATVMIRRKSVRESKRKS